MTLFTVFQCTCGCGKNIIRQHNTVSTDAVRDLLNLISEALRARSGIPELDGPIGWFEIAANVLHWVSNLYKFPSYIDYSGKESIIRSWSDREHYRISDGDLFFDPNGVDVPDAFARFCLNYF